MPLQLPIQTLFTLSSELPSKEKTELTKDWPGLTSGQRATLSLLILESQGKVLLPADIRGVLAEELQTTSWQGRLLKTVCQLALQNARDLLVDTLRALSARISQGGLSIPPVIEDARILLQLLVFPTLDETGAKSLLKTRALWAFSRGIELRTLVQEFLERYHDDLIGFPSRPEFSRALRENTERLLETPDVIMTGAQWIRLYERSVGSDRARGGFERSNFLASSKEAQSLSASDREMLRALLDLYDFLRFEPSDSLVIEFQQQGGRWTQTGEPILPKPRVIPAEPRGLAGTGPAGSRLSDRLRLLAAAGQLERVPEEPEVKSLLLAHQAQTNAALPTAPKELTALAVRLALERAQGLSSPAAARVAVELANLCAKAGKPEYLDIAYFDATTKEFRWKE